MLKLLKEHKYYISFFLVVLVLFFIFNDFIFSNILYIKSLFNFQRTPENAVSVEIPSKIRREEIKIPAIAFRVVDPWTEKTYRDKENIVNIVQKASFILNQADIEIDLIGIKDISLDFKDQDGISYLRPAVKSIQEMPDYNENVLNLVFLNGGPRFSGILPSGLADPDTKSCAVIDRTGFPDFRVLAHEIGHLFNLEHPEPDDPQEPFYLMGDGFILTKEECNTAYKKAEEIIGN